MEEDYFVQRTAELVAAGKFDHLDRDVWDVSPDGVRMKRTRAVYMLTVRPSGASVFMVDPPDRLMGARRTPLCDLAPSELETAAKIVSAIHGVTREVASGIDVDYLADHYPQGVLYYMPNFPGAEAAPV